MSFKQVQRFEGCPIYTNWYDPYNGFFLFARPVRFVRVVHVVKLLFTGRTVGGLHIVRATWSVYDLYNSYGSWNNSLRVVLLVDCISLVHGPYDSRMFSQPAKITSALREVNYHHMAFFSPRRGYPGYFTPCSFRPYFAKANNAFTIFLHWWHDRFFQIEILMS